jgi:hypothetical protein
MLLNFLKHNFLPITREGHFLAYKSVTSDYKDHHTGTFDNHPGTVNVMGRTSVMFDPDVACAKGWHVGTYEFARTFGGAGSHIMVCDVDPFDVVSVPNDANKQKLRTARYRVVAEHDAPLTGLRIYSADGEDLDIVTYMADKRRDADTYGKLVCADSIYQADTDDDDYADDDDYTDDDDYADDEV